MTKPLDEIQKLRYKEKNDKRFTLIKLEIPGGYVCGRWWGPKNGRPFLCLHGWLDNCGVYDRLIPLLPPEFSYLTFDLPGHGLSFKYPPGMIYSTHDTIVLIERIRIAYGWDKVSFIGHSLSGICGFMYAALFPDKIDMLICLDNIQHYLINPIEIRRSHIENVLIEDARNPKIELPTYTYAELLKKTNNGSHESVDEENASYLLTRNVKRSSKYPRKYYFNYDRRLRGFDREPRLETDMKFQAKHITCSILFCFAKDSIVISLNRDIDEYLVKYMMDLNKDIEVFEGPGNHHFLLLNPEDYSSTISNFIRKQRKVPAKL